MQRWQDSLTELSPNTQRTYTAIAKSLVSFAHKLGVVPFNISMPIKAPKSKDCLSQRILSESQVLTMIALESNPRNKLILKVLYYAGLRVSELCGLKWEDLTPNTDNKTWRLASEIIHPYSPKTSFNKIDIEVAISPMTTRYVKYWEPPDGQWNGWGTFHQLRAYSPKK